MSYQRTGVDWSRAPSPRTCGAHEARNGSASAGEPHGVCSPAFSLMDGACQRAAGSVERSRLPKPGWSARLSACATAGTDPATVHSISREALRLLALALAFAPWALLAALLEAR
jgi:hypothetical protein